MVLKLNGIVLNTIKYGETSVIARIYTREQGMHSFMIKGAIGGKRNKTPMLQALQQLEVIAFVKTMEQNIWNVKELTMAYVYKNISYDFHKNAITIFCTEVLYKALKDQAPNELLYDYLIQAFQYFDACTDHYADFHILMMMELSAFLGFSPYPASDDEHFFDLREGRFYAQLPSHTEYLSIADSELFHASLGSSLTDLTSTNWSHTTRQKLLDIWIAYYRIHVHDMQKIQSYEVLKLLFMK